MTVTLILDGRRECDGVSERDTTIRQRLPKGEKSSGFWNSSAGQFDMSGDDAMDVPTVAKKQTAGVVEAETFSCDRRFIGGNYRHRAADQGMMRVVLAKERREGGFGSADQRGAEMAGQGDEDGGQI